jgi:hypothetical protein
MAIRLARPRAAFAILLAVGSAQAADAVTFLRMVRDHGASAEANPLVAHLAGFGHLGPLVLAKLALVALVIAAFAAARQRHAVAGALVATLAVVAGLIGAFSNVAVLLAPGATPPVG